MKAQITPSKNNRNGSILAIAVVIMVILAILGAGMLMLGRGARLIAARTTADMSARLAADAGITKAVYKMNKKLEAHLADGSSWDSNLPFAINESMDNAYSKFSFDVNAIGTEIGNGFTAVSTGSSSNRQRVVKAEVFPVSAWQGIFSDDSITLKANSSFDTYPDSGGDLTLRTNAIGERDVKINKDVSFGGEIEVIVGPGGNAVEVIEGQGVTQDIEDSAYAAVDAVTFDPVNPPDDLFNATSKGSLTGGTLSQADSGKYTDIILDSGDILEIPESVKIYVTGDVELKAGSSVIIKNDDISGNGVDDGELVLFLGGDMVAKNGSVITNEPNDARLLTINGSASCQSIVLMNSSAFCGAILAPEADLKVLNSGKVFGSFVSKTFELKEGAEFFFDTRLYDVNEIGYDIKFNIDYWWED